MTAPSKPELEKELEQLFNWSSSAQAFFRNFLHEGRYLSLVLTSVEQAELWAAKGLLEKDKARSENTCIECGGQLGEREYESLLSNPPINLWKAKCTQCGNIKSERI